MTKLTVSEIEEHYNSLSVSNKKGTQFTFFNRHYSNFVRVETVKGSVYIFEIESGAQICEGILTVSGDNKMPLDSRAKEVQQFLDSQKTRTLISFDSHDEMLIALKSVRASATNGAGQAFESDGKHCFYKYSHKQ